MSRVRYMLLPIAIVVLAVVYWYLSGEAAGAVMLAIFGLAMGVMGYVLVPTVTNVGPTAPVDPDFGDQHRDEG